MKKFTLFLLFTLISCAALFAVPAIPTPIIYTQPNGDTLTVRIKGDERLHWHETLDGYTLLTNQAGYLTYAQLDEDGNLQPSDMIATNIERRNVVVHSFLNTINKKLFYSDMQKQLIRQIWDIEDEVAEMHYSEGTRGVTGQYKTLCAFVQFPEKSFVKTMSQFEPLFNQVGYTGNGTGSVRDFFKEASYNQFDLIITLCGFYTAPQSESYYAGNNGNQNCQALARYVAQQVAAEASINFADYDSNNDGQVDGFHFIFAGRGQEANGGSNTIWSHKWQFSPAVTKNGKSISVYSCSPELLYENITTIGVICHEMSHAFGCADFYDTDGSTGGSYEGTGNWDIMAQGSWNGSPQGNRPAHHNPYVKVQYGWVTPTVLSVPTTVTNMPNSEDNPVMYRINTATNNEYYLLENRQRIKFDTSIPGDGLLIYHVHSAIGSSSINTTHPQKMYPVCASSTVAIPSAGASNYGNINSAGCPFPGTSNKTAFDGTTTPSMFQWNGSSGTVISNKQITDITHSNRLISFKFMGGAATFIPVTNISGIPTTGTATIPLTLSGTVEPANATNRTITWSVENAGTTGATITGGNTLNTTASGTATIKATIANGTSVGSDYTQMATITVSRATLGGTVSITGSAIFGQTLTANTGGLTSTPSVSLGILSYQWKRNGTTNIGTNSNTYTLVTADIDATITVTVTAANCEGSVTSNPTAIVTKATQAAPPAPTRQSYDATSITLTSISNGQYNINNGAFDENNVFSNLLPTTSYSFTQRYKETDTHLASPPSPSASFTTDRATLSGTVSITGNTILGQTLTVNTEDLTSTPVVSLGTLTYQWKRNGTINIGTNSTTYTLVQADIGATITVTVTAANCNGSVTSNPTATITKIPQDAPTAAPTMFIRTSTEIALNPIPNGEYNINGGTFGSSVNFGGLAPNTAYIFTQRYAETATHLPSPPSPPATFSTTLPILTGTITITGNAVFGETLTAHTNGLTSDPVTNIGVLTYQWKRNGTIVIGTNSTTYTLVAGDIGSTITVMVMAANCIGSVNSAPTEIVTKAPQDAPPPPTMHSYTATSITLNPIPNGEYNLDGGAFTNNNVFDGLEITPGDTYTFTQRYGETATHLASPPSQAATFSILPMLSGTVMIIGETVFGETLTANTDGLTSIPETTLGTLMYQWKSGNNDVGDNADTYTLTVGDIGNTLTVTVIAENCTGSVTSEATEVVTKATQAAPDAPTMEDHTLTSITLDMVSGCEYNINDGAFTDNNLFEDLEPNTSYIFTQRYSETETHFASPPSEAATFSTLPLGVEELKIKNYELKIYPNPTNGELRIENGELRIENIEIFDVYGRKISSHHLIPTSSHHLINISHLPTGMYFVRIQTEDNIVTQKVIKE